MTRPLQLALRQRHLTTVAHLSDDTARAIRATALADAAFWLAGGDAVGCREALGEARMWRMREARHDRRVGHA